jgi:hypothetical protein
MVSFDPIILPRFDCSQRVQPARPDENEPRHAFFPVLPSSCKNCDIYIVAGHDEA